MRTYEVTLRHENWARTFKVEASNYGVALRRAAGMSPQWGAQQGIHVFLKELR